MAFKYGGERRKSEDVIRDSKTSGGLYDSYLQQDVNSFKSNEGENKVRILPGSWKEEDGNPARDWAYGVYLHYDIGPDKAAFLCEAKMKPGAKCVICEARAKATDEDESYALKFSWRPHCYLIDRRTENAGPLVWGMPRGVFNEINARCIDRHTGEVLLIDHPEKGYDVFFDREGSKLRTKYKAVDIARDSSFLSRNDDSFWVDEDREGNVIYGGAWLEHINEHPIPELLVFYEQEYIESVLYARPVDKSERRSRSDNDDDRGSRRGDREREAEDIRGRRRGDDDEPPRRRLSEDDEPPRRRAAADDEPPRRRSTEDDDAPPRRRTTSDEEAPPRRRLATEEEDAPPRRRAPVDDDEPPRRRTREPDPDEEAAPRRRAAAEEEEAPRRRTNGGGEEEPPFEPRSRARTDEDEGNPTQNAKAALEDLKNERRSRD